MKWSLVSLLLFSLAGCQPQPALSQEQKPIVSQRSISEIACGPCAMFNWMSHGGTDLQHVLESIGKDRTPQETVRRLIKTYGRRDSATRPSVKRYGTHNGGVGSINLMLMARELLADHLDSPPNLRGEYLQRREDETTNQHLERIKDWFSTSIDSGFPVLFYIRCYNRTDQREPPVVFGHHVVITAMAEDVTQVDGESPRVGFTFIDSSSGRVHQGFLEVARDDFTTPTFTYRFQGKRALTTKSVRSDRPLLEFRARSYERTWPHKTRIIAAHFATFADGKVTNQRR